MENPVVHDAQSATDWNTGFSIFHIRFFIFHFGDYTGGKMTNLKFQMTNGKVSDPVAIAPGTDTRAPGSNKLSCAY
jgi:hypothetical protein